MGHSGISWIIRGYPHISIEKYIQFIHDSNLWADIVLSNYMISVPVIVSVGLFLINHLLITWGLRRSADAHSSALAHAVTPTSATTSCLRLGVFGREPREPRGGAIGTKVWPTKSWWCCQWSCWIKIWKPANMWIQTRKVGSVNLQKCGWCEGSTQKMIGAHSPKFCLTV